MQSVVFDKLPAHDTCWSITTGADGKIYAGACGEITGGLGVFIVSYDPDRDEHQYLLEVSCALNEPVDSGRATQSKIHGCMVPASTGELYCATHASGPPIGHAVWRPWNTWDDDQRMFSGFHIFMFDPQTGEVDDFGCMSPNEGSRAMALAEDRGLLYGVTWPRDHWYVYDIRKREYRDFGRLSDVNPQSVWVDPEGNGYTSTDMGYIVKYDADRDRLIQLDARIPLVESAPSPQRTVYDTVPSPDGKSIYGVAWNMHTYAFCEHLFRFDFDTERMHDLGRAADDGEEWISMCGGLVFGWDGWLYYSKTKQKDHGRLPWTVFLSKLNPETLVKEEICPMDDGEWQSEDIAKATRDFHGNLYFADTNNRPVRIYKYSPENSNNGGGDTERYLRPWG